MKVTLYGVEGCPRCWSLGQLLKKHGIEYTKISDVETITKEKDLDSIPAIEVDGQILYMQDAVQWLKQYKSKQE